MDLIKFKPILSEQLLNIDEKETNRWRALFDDKFNENDIRLILLIYYYLKSSGLYDHETNIFIISIQKYLHLKDIVDSSKFKQDMVGFYGSCYIDDSSKVTSELEQDVTALFLRGILKDNMDIITYISDLIKNILDHNLKKDNHVQLGCMLHYNTHETTEKELDFNLLLRSILNVLNESIEHIKRLLTMKADQLLKEFLIIRTNYTSTTSDFIELLQTLEINLDLNTIINILRHSLYNFCFNISLIPYSNTFQKKILLYKRLQAILLDLNHIFKLLPLTLYIQLTHKELSNTQLFSIQIEDIINMSYYRRNSIAVQEYVQLFLSQIEAFEISTFPNIFYELYIHIFNGVIECIEEDTEIISQQSIDTTSKASIHSVHSVHSNLKQLLCDLNPKDILLELTKEEGDFKTLFTKPDISDSMLTNPNILLIKLLIKSDYNVPLEEMLYFALGFCNLENSGVIHYVGEVMETELYNFEANESIDTTLIHVHKGVPLEESGIVNKQVFYIECSEISDVEHIKESLQTKSNMLLQLSSDIASVYIN